MRISRIFTDLPLSPGTETELGEAAARYIGQVLRLRPGQSLVLFDGSGVDHEAGLIRCDRRGCRVRVIRALTTEPAPPIRVHLGIGISRGERMDYAIQKSVELGVAAITPLFTARGVVRLKAERLQKRIAHWQGVVVSACEQSGRSRLPALNPPLELADWLRGRTQGLLLHHEAAQPLTEFPHPGDALNLLIGPEGGLQGSERELALAGGFAAVRLGPRILRTETAPLAALAAIQTLWGDFR